MTIRIVIADDHPIVLDGLEQLLRLEDDFDVVARCSNGREALEATLAHRPDLLLLDIRMPELAGIEVLAELRRRASPARVVLLTAAIEDDEVLEAVSLGVRGVVLKEMAPQLLLRCLRKVHAGGEWLERESFGRALEAAAARAAPGGEGRQALTRRELEIVRLVGEGLRNREIAERLFISGGTVKVHLHNIFDKLGIDRRAALVRYATDKRIAPAPPRDDG